MISQRQLEPELGSEECLIWKIQLRVGSNANKVDLPTSVMTVVPGFQHESMPDEVGILLPTNCGPRLFVTNIEHAQPKLEDTILGLFLADPFFNVSREKKRLEQTGIEWITNLPSIEQQDVDFSSQLPDVGLGREREQNSLKNFRAAGFKIAAVVADGDGARDAISVGPGILIVMPRVIDFAAGFPSRRQRGAAAMEVRKVATEKKWTGHLLCLGDRSEVAHESLWPEAVDGLICRPIRQPIKGHTA